MNTIKLYITIEVPDDFYDHDYNENMEAINEGIQDLADAVDGEVIDVEIK